MTTNKTRRRMRAPLFAALLLAGLSAPALAHDDHLRLAYGWYPTSFDYAQSNPYAIFGRQIVDTLLSENRETGAFEPYLAEAWQVLDEGRTFEFVIREGVTFSNGEALDAQVVADNFETLWRFAQEGVSPTVAAYLRGYDRSEVVDAHTVRIHFTEPNAGFLQANTEGQFGIVAPETLARSPEERSAQGVIGSGPFVLEQAVLDERVEFVRREGYDWAPAAFGRSGEAALERITFQIVPEESVRAAGVLAGDYDIAYSIFESGLAQAAGRDDVEAVFAPNRGVINSFLVNTSDPVLADRAVRQALQHGINRQELVDTFYAEGVEAASDVVSRGHPYYQDRSELLRYDPELSRSLLDDAGWVVGEDGIRAKDGQRLEFELIYVGSIGSVEAGWQYVQSQLADIGIALTLRPISNAEQVDLRSSGNWQLGIAQGAARGDADGIAAYYHTQLITWKGQAPRPEVDALLEEQARTVDRQARGALIDEAVTTILTEGYGIPLYDSSQVLLVRDVVEDLTFPVNSWEPLLYRVSKSAP